MFHILNCAFGSKTPTCNDLIESQKLFGIISNRQFVTEAFFRFCWVFEQIRVCLHVEFEWSTAADIFRESGGIGTENPIQ